MASGLQEETLGDSATTSSGHEVHFASDSRQTERGTVSYHVEDISDAEHHPPWSTGVSRMQSRAHTPANSFLGPHEVDAHGDHARFDHDNSSFNPARIPLNLVGDEAEEDTTNQLPIADIIKHVDENTFAGQLAHLDHQDPAEVYEHQNAAENYSEDFEETTPVINADQSIEGIDDTANAVVEDSIVIHDMDEHFSETANSINHSHRDSNLSGDVFVDEADFESMIAHHELDQTRHEDPHSTTNFNLSIPEVDVQEGLPDEAASDDVFDFLVNKEESRRNFDGTEVVKDSALEIPDELDEADYDLEEDLDAEFAAMEASFKQTMITDVPTTETIDFDPREEPAVRETTPSATKQYVPRKSSNPYAPKVISDTQDKQSSSTLFTPANMLQSAPAVGNQYAYNPLPQQSFRAPQVISNERVRPASAASFVSGKVAYTDPYALPDTLVAKARPRPQAQSLRNVASVPNFKAREGERPPLAQRHASSTGPPQSVSTQGQQPFNNKAFAAPNTVPLQQMQATPDRQPTSMGQIPTVNARYMPQPHVRYDRGMGPETQVSLPPTQSIPTTMQRQTYTSHDGQSHSASTTVYRGDSFPTDFAEQPLRTNSSQSFAQDRQAVLHAQPSQPYNFKSPPPSDSRGQGIQSTTSSTYGGVQAFPNAPPPMQRRPSPYDPQRSQSIDNVMRGINIPTSNTSLGRIASPLGHDRHASSMSTASESSEAPRQEAIGEFLNQQRGAESQMFDDAYAVAHDELREAQTIQRANSAFLSDKRVPSRVNDALPDRTALRTPVSFPDTGTNLVDGYSPRRSLEDSQSNVSLNMSRPPTRSANNQYAHTEPSSSPRQVHTVPNEYRPVSSQTATTYRPPITTRATSSAHHLPRPQKTTNSQSQYQAIPKAFTNPTEPGQADPLLGHPVASFGFGGKLVTSLPRTIPRFSQGNTMVAQIAGPGPVVIRPLKDVVPDDIFADFPGPLTHSRLAVKQNKGDLQLWLAKRIPPGDSASQDDRTVLYRLLMVLLECNGSLDTLEKSDKLVKLLCPDLQSDPSEEDSSNFKVPANLVGLGRPSDLGPVLSTSTLTENSIQKLSELLLRGNKDGALRYASDQGLWAHALVIASRSGPEAWANVLHEFATSDLQSNSDAAQNLKFLYGSFASSTDKNKQSGMVNDSYTLQNWRKSLTMILNNRIGQEDSAITSLGQSLLASGQIYAAHFCLLLCIKPAIGPVDDTNAIFSLIGLQNSIIGGWTLEKNEAVIMSEIYEFAMTLAQPKSSGLPHLLAFKLQRAHLLTDAGHVAAAKRYCEGITAALKVLPKTTAHLHHVLIEQLRDLSHRIDQNPGEETPSWLGSKIARPKIDNIWGSLEGKFNKFVAGDADESEQKIDSNIQGPFGKLAQTPAISRVQSSVDVRSRQASAQGYPVGGYGQDSLQPSQPSRVPDHGSYPYAAPSNLGVFSSPSNMPGYPASAETIYQGPPQSSQDVLQRPPSRYQPNQDSLQQQAQAINAQYGLSQNDINHGEFGGFDSSPRHDLVASPTNRYAPTTQTVPQQYSALIDNHTNTLSAPNDRYVPPQIYGDAAPHLMNGSLDENYQNDDASRMAAGNLAQDTQNHSSYLRADQSPEQPSLPAEALDIPEKPSTPTQNSAKDEKSSDVDAGEKKSGWLGGWFGGKKKEAPTSKDADVKVHKAKLGEGMSLVYDPVTKKWTNPKGSMPEESKTSAPPPPMSKKAFAPPTSASPTVAQGSFNNAGLSNAQQPSNATSNAMSPNAGTPPLTNRSSAIPPRKLANAEDDLAAMLGAGPAPRRAASGAGPPQAGPGAGNTMPRAKKGRPAKRYVDVFQEG